MPPPQWQAKAYCTGVFPSPKDERRAAALPCWRRHLQDSTNTFDKTHKLHTYSVGIEGSPDLAAARKVADFLGTEHHEVTFTVEQGLDALSDLIYYIESYEQVASHPNPVGDSTDIEKTVRIIRFRSLMSSEQSLQHFCTLPHTVLTEGCSYDLSEAAIS